VLWGIFAWRGKSAAQTCIRIYSLFVWGVEGRIYSWSVHRKIFSCIWCRTLLLVGDARPRFFRPLRPKPTQLLSYTLLSPFYPKVCLSASFFIKSVVCKRSLICLYLTNALFKFFKYFVVLRARAGNAKARNYLLPVIPGHEGPTQGERTP
jgi:hypothetical protein